MQYNEVNKEFRVAVTTSLISNLSSIQNDNIPYLNKRENFIKLFFDNDVIMYFDNSSLPFDCSDVTDLSKRYVLYGICCGDKIYVGKTMDFGERMMTHVKDSKKYKSSTRQSLYKDIKARHECICFVIYVASSEEELKNAEHIAITECKKKSIQIACGYDEDYINFIMCDDSDSNEFASIYCYNIAN